MESFKYVNKCALCDDVEECIPDNSDKIKCAKCEVNYKLAMNEFKRNKRHRGVVSILLYFLCIMSSIVVISFGYAWYNIIYSCDGDITEYSNKLGCIVSKSKTDKERGRIEREKEFERLHQQYHEGGFRKMEGINDMNAIDGMNKFRDEMMKITNNSMKRKDK